ncbi:aspartic protease [Fistulina hepatica ATCC 64428]|uniref:Aspartic protease n=1 Tax=Fistulina hepatica ATCC 64428 TaxID=1128425 RepID=A0A0D7AN62_9AGAR|nr:aspartic protease [Fistulina hepatica ATCC 64428]
MFIKASLLSVAAFTVVVSATPVLVPRTTYNMALTKHLNATGFANMVAVGRARAKAFRDGTYGVRSRANDKRDDNEDATNDVVTYTASVGVGADDEQYDLIIDTGSSNTWVGADKTYTETSTSSDTGEQVSVTYGSGSFSGTEYIDEVTITSDLIVTKQSIGVASESSDFTGYDGILGIGPTDLTEGTLSDSDAEIPTVADNLYSQGTISEEVIGIFFEPTDEVDVENGVLTWGGTDDSLYTGDITYTSITSTYPSDYYWGIDQTIEYGSTTILSTTAGIVDTGTTLLYIATNAYDAYVEATGATYDEDTGLLKISSSGYDELESLIFTIGGTAFEFTANAQIWPRALNEDIGGSADSIYLVVADIGTDSGSGLDFIDGYVFLERFYSVFDTTNSRVGFAETSYTSSTLN